MSDTVELTLNNPLTAEEWDMLTDVDFDNTERIEFETKHGKHVEFVKVIRCKDCKYWVEVPYGHICDWTTHQKQSGEGYCELAKRKKNE